jgi:hypothetical protein
MILCLDAHEKFVSKNFTKHVCTFIWLKDTTISESKEHYFKRVWRAGCDGAPLDEWVEGFEEAYKKRMNK